ncbi:hypothetical protein ACWDA7_34685 [Streptomyces sp. NPDC001156]
MDTMPVLLLHGMGRSLEGRQALATGWPQTTGPSARTIPASV